MVCMKGRTVGGLLTSGLVALALALALLQAAVLAQMPRPAPVTTNNVPAAPSNRYSAPGGRAGVPWTPTPTQPKPAPSEREGRTPDQKPQREEHRAPLRNPNFIPHLGPRPARRALA
jgi:hypothetical protein